MNIFYVGLDSGSSSFQLYEVLDQSVAAQEQARLLMLRAAQAFPEIKLLRTVPGIGPIGACRFSAYIHTPQRFSSKRKLWVYKMVLRLTAWLLANNSMMQLETPAGVS